MSEAGAAASSRRLSRASNGGTGGITKVKPTTKQEANEDAELLAVAEQSFARRRKETRQTAKPVTNRADPRTDIKREFRDEEGKLLTRRVNRNNNPFDLPKHLLKVDWDYEWKTIRTMGEHVDPSEIVDLRDGGWRNASAKEFKEIVPPGWDKPYVERGGQILMQRPMRLTLEARREELTIAEDQKYDKLKGAAAGPAELGKVTRRITTEMKMTRGRADLSSDIEG